MPGYYPYSFIVFSNIRIKGKNKRVRAWVGRKSVGNKTIFYTYILDATCVYILCM